MSAQTTETAGAQNIAQQAFTHSPSRAGEATSIAKELSTLRIPKIEQNTDSQVDNKHQQDAASLHIPSQMPTFKISPLRIPKKSAYPRKANICGNEWVRHYSKKDRKYYWLLTLNGKNVAKEWDPWRTNNQIAPWLTSIQTWKKFVDREERRAYYYNYKTQESTFDRPQGFESEPEIEYDSADDDF